MSHATHVGGRHGIRSFFEDPRTGKIVIWEMPNVPLWIWIASMVVSRFVTGTAHTIVAGVGTAALVVWSVLEIWKGDSPFRRVLGGVVLAGLVAGLLLR